jgi:broad specificity phosphatase PhoE/ribonuclease HI
MRELPAHPGPHGRLRALNAVARRVVVEADGGSRGNPGPAGYGAVVRDADTGEVLAERKQAIGVDTNNVAEYRGLIAGLEAAAEIGASSVQVRMDSKLVVEQVSGRWQVKNERLRPLASQAAVLRRSFADITFEWIPREHNRHADRLANEAMDEAAGRPRSGAPARATPPGAADPAPSLSWVPPTGPATRLLLVRHGATEHTAEQRFSGRIDVPLTAIGVRQVEQVADRMAALADLAFVVTSPLQRARQSADLIADRLGLDVRVVDDLTELDFGAWDGLTYDDVVRRWPEELRAWSTGPDASPSGGESLGALTRRVRRARDGILQALPVGRVVVVSHVTPIKTLLRLALDAPDTMLFRLHLDPASVSIVDYGAAGSTSVRLVNDTGHLDPSD